MSRLVIVVEVDTDASLVDPGTVAEDVVDAYDEDRRHGAVPGWLVEFVASSWVDSLRSEVAEGLPT